MTVTADALGMLAGDPPRTRLPGDFHRHPTTGAPYVAHPTETNKDGTPRRVMYGRPSSFGAALDNPYNLLKWKERQLLIGASILEPNWRPVDPDDRDSLDMLAAYCHQAAGSHIAADRGTHVHLLCEWWDREPDDPRRGDLEALLDAGERLGIPRKLQTEITMQWVAFRHRLGLTALAVEQTVVNDRWRLAGTLDRLDVADHDILTAYGVIQAGVPFVGDIKTGGLTLGNDGQPNYWVKYPVQFAAYVDAVPYDVETDERQRWQPEIPHAGIAIIYHYDLARALAGEVVDWQAIPVNVQAGREGGDLCRAAADFAKRRDLFAMPAPTTIDVVIEADTSAFEAAIKELRKHGVKACKSCGASIIWIKTATGKSIPIDPDQVLGGNIEIQNGVAVVVAGRSDESRWISHFVSCPNADEHRKIAAPVTSSVEQPTAAPVPAGAAVEPDKLRARIAELVAAGHEQMMRRHWPTDVPTLKHTGHTDDQLTRILAAVRSVEAQVGATWHPDDGAGPSVRLAQKRALRAWEGRHPDECWFAASLIATFEQCRNPDVTLEAFVAQFTIEQAERLYLAAGQE